MIQQFSGSNRAECSAEFVGLMTYCGEISFDVTQQKKSQSQLNSFLKFLCPTPQLHGGSIFTYESAAGSEKYCLQYISIRLNVNNDSTSLQPAPAKKYQVCFLLSTNAICFSIREDRRASPQHSHWNLLCWIVGCTEPRACYAAQSKGKLCSAAFAWDYPPRL
jgi:hypothetical protein